MALTQDELLEVWKRVLPGSYTTPLEDENNGQGLDLVYAIAAVFERVAVSIETTTQAMYVFPHSDQLAPPAAGAAESTGTINVTRTAPAFGDVELLDGDELSTVLTSADGDEVVELGVEIDGDQTIPGGAFGPTTVSVRSARAGHHANVEVSTGRTIRFLRRTTATLTGATATATNTITAAATGDQLDEGMVGAFVRFTAGSNISTFPRRITAYDSTTGAITVDGAALTAGAGTESLTVVDLETMGLSAELASDLTGGTSPWLDQIGDERSKGRNPNETDTSYRGRIRELPDVVSPNAIYRACSRILTPLGIPWELHETRGHEGVDSYPFRGFFADVDPCDDPIDAPDTNERVLLGSRMDRQGFIVIVQRDGYGDFGAPCDFKPPNGVHPSNAVDWMFCDGYPLGFWNDLIALIKEVEEAKMAGVPWLLVLVNAL